MSEEAQSNINNSEDTSYQAALTQTNYVPSPYQPSSWEVIGEIEEEHVFTPMEIHVLSNAEHMVDPMFFDYGGRDGSKEKIRFHMPAGAKEMGMISGKISNGSAKENEEDMENTIRLTEEELNQKIQEAYQKGRSDVENEFKEAEQERISQMEARLEELVSNIEAAINEKLAEIEDMATKVSIELAKNIINYAVEINPEYIIDIVKKAIAAAGGSKIRKIKVSTDDYEFVELIGLDKALKSVDDNWRFEADENIHSGCIIETSSGEVDYRLDDMWERVKEKALKVLR